MLQIVQAYDRLPIAEVVTDGVDALEAKLDPAARAFRARDRWLKPHERIEVTMPARCASRPSESSSTSRSTAS
jgi:hypothetical protein